MKPNNVELHDAIIESMTVNYAKKLLSIDLEFYPDPITSSKRVPATISFSGVEKLSEISDFVDLAKNRGMGNIVYWHPAIGSGTTYLYLTSGIIAVTAGKVKFSRKKET